MDHLLLLIEYRNQKPLKEPVHVEPLGKAKFRLLHSPGLVQGIAAGDEFRVVNDDGAFEIIRRSGNIVVQVFSRDSVAPHAAALTQEVERLLGRLDGQIERGLVFTLPFKAGFSEIERVFNDWVAAHAGWEWYFGNVYDARDGVTPLNWWLDGEFHVPRD